LAILGILGAGLAVMEATVQGDAGRIETYDTKDETMKGHGVRLACSC